MAALFLFLGVVGLLTWAATRPPPDRRRDRAMDDGSAVDHGSDAGGSCDAGDGGGCD